MELKICGRCKQAKQLAEFYTHRKHRYQTWCKDCKREFAREYVKRPKAIEARQRTQSRLVKEGYFKKKERDPRTRIRYLARWYAKRMLRQGAIEKQPCAECGEGNSQIHHPNYNEPLLIVWLCAECHRKLHRQLKRSIDEK